MVQGVRWCKVSRRFRQSSSLFSTTGNGTTSAVSADAREPVEMFLLDRVDFQRLGLGEHFRTELENRVRTLEDCGLFTGETLWDKQELRELAKVAMPLVFKRGSIILEQGAKLGTLYVLKRGVCRVVQKSDYEKELRRRKGELEKSLDSFDMNYIYHVSFSLLRT